MSTPTTKITRTTLSLSRSTTRVFSASLALSASMMLANPAAADGCGDVTIADMNWNSATLIANIDRFILEHGYGCSAELVPGDTMPTGTSMIEKAEPDIAPEMWSNGMREALDKGVAEKRLRYAGHSLSDGGEEGFWVPAYLVKQYPELATLDGVRKHAKLFEHPEDPDMSAFYGCPAGWNCQITASNLFRAMKLADNGFDIIDPGSSAGLAGSIAKAYAREEAWFGYYWAPTAVLGKYDMVRVDFGSGVDRDAFYGCLAKEDCADPVVSEFPRSEVKTLTTESFASRSPAVYDYLSKRSFTNQQMNNLLAWMEENQADGEVAMEYFLEEHEAIWTQWLAPEIAGRVRDAL